MSQVGTIVRTYPPNPALYPPNTTNVGSYELSREECVDLVGPPWVDSPFSKKMGACPRISVNGVRTQTGFVYTTNNIPLQPGISELVRQPWAYSYFEKDPIGAATLASMAVANMNPNRPDRDIPTSILELHELPSLLKESVTMLITKRRGDPPPSGGSARANLMAQFGIMPILQDLVYLFNFASEVDKREKYLRELSTGFRRIKRRLTVEEWEGSRLNQVAFHSVADNQSSTNKCHVYSSASREYWYTARAKLINPPPEREIRFLAEQLSSGTHTVTAEAVWNLIPWSWLIDWFSNTGSLLAAYRGGVPWEWEGLNVMYKTTYDMRVVFPSLRTGFTVSPAEPKSRAVTKVRIQPFVSFYPQWSIPYLTARQWSILQSLFLLRVL